MLHGTQLFPQSVPQSVLNLVDPVGNLDAVTLQFLQAYVQNNLRTQNWKTALRVASLTNINIAAPGASIDGVTMVSGDRFGAFGQSTGSQNGSYIWNGAATPATRTTDFDIDTEVIDGSVFPINEGTLADQYYKLTTNNPIVVGTTTLTFVNLIPTTASAVMTSANKDMTASTTVADFDLACATNVVGTPTNDGYVRVLINGLGYSVGDGVKTKSCYFSADSGATAKTIANIASGDRLYWVGSVAGHQLISTWKVDFDFAI